MNILPKLFSNYPACLLFSCCATHYSYCVQQTYESYPSVLETTENKILGLLGAGRDQLSVFSTKKSFIVIDSNRLVLPDPVVFRVSFDLLLFRGGKRSVRLFSRNVKTRVKNVIMLETNRQAKAGMQTDKLSYWHKL